MNMPQYVTILGSTGSVGCNTLNIIRQHPERYKVFALAAKTQIDKILAQCIEFIPQYVVIPDLILGKVLKEQLASHNISTIVLFHNKDIIWICEHQEVDIVMSAIVGSRGLLPTYHAIKANKKVLLANKESLITGGKLIKNALQNSQAQLIPVDSEHSAIFQALPYNNTTYNKVDISTVNRLILTASGGPFRKLNKEELTNVTSSSAIKHPNWSMGKKISVDSSTLMNKGLEVIEAYWLFGVEIDQIEVIVHPQSIIHSMVEYIDNSIIAQMGSPDMRTPIAYALAFPDRISSGSKKLDFSTLSELTFEAPSYNRFPCLKLAFTALKSGGAATAVLNAANEVAVAAFLANRIKFYDINKVIESSLDKFAGQDFSTIEEVIEIDLKTREYAANLIDIKIEDRLL